MTEFLKKLDKIIEKHDNVIIMGHQNPDLDCIGSSVGLYKAIDKECYIFKTLDKLNTSAQNAFKELKNINFVDKINYKKILKNTLLIITDLHKTTLLEYAPILEEIKDIVVIDHHIIGSNKIESTLEYIDPKKSSATEMIIEYLKYKNKKLDKVSATIMLTGIEIDTNGYNNKTTKETFLASAYLMEQGADNILKQNILKENKEEYIKRTKQIEKSYLINNNMICTIEEGKYNSSYLATLSEDLLRFEKVESSFTIAQLLNNKIGISARSLGNVDVERIMKKFGGGGHLTDAACQIENKTIKEIEKELITYLEK